MLADAILVVHFAFVVFVVGGFILIVAGGIAGWRWVRNRAFRLAHLAAIVFVAAEALAGISCPLTVWEDALRRAAPDAPGFVARWVGRLLYYDLPLWVFTVAYVVFAIAVAVTFRLVPPRVERARKALSSPGRRSRREGRRPGALRRRMRPRRPSPCASSSSTTPPNSGRRSAGCSAPRCPTPT